jgi:hypothetical protein
MGERTSLGSVRVAAGLLCVLVALPLGCRQQVAGEPEKDPNTADLKKVDYQCASDSDCVIGCTTLGNCCQTWCYCKHSVNTKWADAVRRANRKQCDWSEECPHLKCTESRYSYTPYCSAGQCKTRKKPMKPY